MTTRSELIETISSALHSYTGVHEQVTYLTGDIDEADLTVPVGSSDAAVRGIAEVGDELLYIDTAASNTLALAPFGRGYRGTTAAAHTTNTMLTYDPTFPRVEIGKCLDQVVAGLYPALFQVKTTTLTSQTADVSFDLPTDVERILFVDVKRDGDPADYWATLVSYEFQPGATPTLNLYGGSVPGYEIRVTYAAQFDELTVDLATSGIPESCEDLIVYAVTSRMIRFLEPARLQLGSVENISRANHIQVGDAGRTATQLFALAQQRIAEERRKLLELYPARPNFLAR